MPPRRPRAVLARLALAGAVSALVALGIAGPVAAADPSPSPSADPTPTPTATPEPTPAPSASPEPSPSPAPSASPPASPSPDPSPSPTPDPSPTPTPTPSPTPSPSPAPTFSMNLYRSAAYVRQYDSSWCTGAATQMMGNLIRLRSNPSGWIDRWWSRQRAIVRYAKARDTLARSNGTDPQGWAAALRGYGMGATYTWQAFPDFDAALRQAVIRLRATGRPVGLLAWSGRHAWVLHGFTATADPATTDDFRVTQLRISGPLKGTDPINGAYTPSQLRTKWGRYAERDGYLGWVGDFVFIAP